MGENSQVPYDGGGVQRGGEEVPIVPRPTKPSHSILIISRKGNLSPQSSYSFHMSSKHSSNAPRLDVPNLDETIDSPGGEVMPSKGTKRVEPDIGRLGGEGGVGCFGILLGERI